MMPIEQVLQLLALVIGLGTLSFVLLVVIVELVKEEIRDDAD